MLRELERWWMLTNTDISLDGGRDVVSFDEYKVFYQRLAYAVRGETLEGASLLQAMEADWLHDSKGKQFIVRQDFFDSIYEMALTWTAPDQETDDDLTVAELVTFLKDLALRLFGTNSGDIEAWWVAQTSPKRGDRKKANSFFEEGNARWVLKKPSPLVRTRCHNCHKSLHLHPEPTNQPFNRQPTNPPTLQPFHHQPVHHLFGTKTSPPNARG
jgi:hypothetical protein